MSQMRSSAEEGGRSPPRGRGREVRALVCRPGAQGGLDALRQFREGGGLEDAAQGDLEAEGLVDAGEELGGEEGVATEVEEVVADADAVEFQERGPQDG